MSAASSLARILRRVRYLVQRRRLDAELREEIEAHRALRQRQFEVAGMSTAAAEAASRAAMGNMLIAREDARDVWLGALTEWIHDLRFGTRLLRRASAVAIVVVVTMTIAIGMNVGMFAVIDAVWRQPLRFPDASRLVWITNHDPRTGQDTHVSRADVGLWRTRAHEFAEFGLYGDQEATVSSRGDVTREHVVAVSASLWRMIGATAAIGRLFDERSPDAVVISQAFADRHQQGSSPIGSILAVNGHPMQVVGVVPRSYRPDLPGIGNGEPALYIPLPSNAGRPGFPDQPIAGRPTPPWVSVIGRLRAGSTVPQARADLEPVHRAIAQEYPSPLRDRTLRVVPLRDKVVGDVTGPLTVLTVAVILILLASFANLLHVLVAHAASRRAELQTRRALGVSRVRLVRQFLAEGLILATAGTVGGLLLARAFVSIVMRVWPDALPRLQHTGLSWSLVLVAIGVGLTSAVVFAAAPGLALLESNQGPYGRTTASRTLSRARDVLVATQLAVATMLLVAAGLSVKSFWIMGRGGVNSDPASILVTNVSLTGERYRVRAAQEQYVDDVLDATRNSSSIESVGIDAGTFNVPATIQAAGLKADPVTVAFKPVSDGFLQTVGAHLVRGHWPAAGALDSNGLNASDGLIVNHRFAQQIIGATRDPIGVRVAGPFVDGTIAGVVEDFKDWRLDAEVPPQVYVPFKRAQILRAVRIVVRPRDTVSTGVIADQIRRVDPSQALGPVTTLEAVLDASVTRRRLLLWLVSAFAMTAVLLAVTGAYGIVAHGVAQRRREIGIRLALGATPSVVIGTLLRQALRVALAGVLGGTVLASITAPALRAFLYGVAPHDPWTYAVVASTLTLVVAAACWRAASIARHVNPRIVLQG